MTDLAIIGDGIGGLGLLYSLARDHHKLHSITVFHSHQFSSICSLNSTAIVALRGTTRGHSPLGDLLCDGFQTFSKHVSQDKPEGVEMITHYSSSSLKNGDTPFFKRFSAAQEKRFYFHQPQFIHEESAFLISPKIYLNWLKRESEQLLGEKIIWKDQFITGLLKSEKIELTSVNQDQFHFDQVVFSGGSANRFWKNLAPESLLSSSQPIQGSYLHFSDVNWPYPSFSLTHDGDNLVWNQSEKVLLIGSTTLASNMEIVFSKELEKIYQRLENALVLKLPLFSNGKILIGLREKVQKRTPYYFGKDNIFFLGGYYKNGFSLSHEVAGRLKSLILSS